MTIASEGNPMPDQADLLRKRIKVESVVSGQEQWRRDPRRSDVTIEGDYEVEDDQHRNGPSGWTRH